MRLDVHADPSCPWCLIGQTELDLALDSRPGHRIRVAWRPTRLTPDMPRSGMKRARYLRERFGEGAAIMMHPAATRMAELGLTLNASEWQPDTTDAHRVVFWAARDGTQHRVMTALMRAHWTEARNVGDRAVLIDIARAAGMDADMVARRLATDFDRAVILEHEANARARGIVSLPCYVIDDRYALSGAQTAERWRELIDAGV